MRLLLFFILFILTSLVQAQTKNEIEKRIDKKEVPKEVLKWFNDTYEKAKKVKWYYQTDGLKEVYEAKLNYKDKQHSVEVSPNGAVVNIEIIIPFIEITTEVKSEIDAYFKSNFSKIKIKKCQIQYVGGNDDLKNLIDKNERNEAIEINYEIEFYGKNDSGAHLWEGLFNERGKIKEFRRIKLKATDNLDY